MEEISMSEDASGQRLCLLSTPDDRELLESSMIDMQTNWTFLSTPFKKRYAKKYELQSVNEEKTSLKRSFNCSSRNSLQHFRWHPRTIGVHKACVESGNSLLVSNFSNR